MKIYPAIDLIAGQVVRLNQGRFDQQTTYALSPLEVAQDFARRGARFLHLVDLDGARSGAPQQGELLRTIAAASGLKIQAGGGIRTAEHVAQLIEAGVERVVIGSLAIQNEGLTRELFARFGGEHLTLGLDVQLDENGQAMVATHGWREVSALGAEEVLRRYMDCGLQQVLCTDIAKDGMLRGPNFGLYAQLQERFPSLTLLASGGVHASADIARLKREGIGGAIIGKALYEGKLTIEEALSC